MKTGLSRRLKKWVARVNLFRFNLRKRCLGFEYANVFLQRLDKNSTVLILQKHGARIGENCDIESGLVFHNCTDYSHLRIGNNCHIGKGCFFDLRGPVQIGNNVVISMRCNFITHIDLEKSPLSDLYPAKTAGISIRDNCYIGANVTVLMGVTIDKNAIIAAKALVKKSVPPSVVAGGIPARKLKEIQYWPATFSQRPSRNESGQPHHP